MLYLITCDHGTAQSYPEGTSLTDPANSLQAQFKDFIHDAAATYKPALIAEESNAEILRNAQRCSVVLEAANELGIEPRFCEPTRDEKTQELSIAGTLPFLGPGPSMGWEVLVPTVEAAWRHDIAHRFPVREGFWIKKLGGDITKDVLFICGDAHRWTFRRRLEARGIKVRIIGKRFGVKPFSRKYFDVYREVRRNGFPPATGCFCVSPEPIDV